MITEAQLTAAPLEFNANGKTYLLSPMTDVEFGQLLIWIQDKMIAVAKRMVTGLEPANQQALLQHAYDKVQRLQLTSPEATEHLVSLEGGIMIAWLSLRKAQPMITREEVVAIMSDPIVAPALMEKIERLRELHSADPFPPKKISKRERQAARKRPPFLRRNSTTR